MCIQRILNKEIKVTKEYLKKKCSSSLTISGMQIANPNNFEISFYPIQNGKDKVTTNSREM